MEELGDQAPAELKGMLEGKIKDVKDAIESDDTDKIKETTTELENSLQALAEAAQQAGAAGAAPDMGGAPAEEPESSEPKKAKGKVVDAEVVED